MGNIFKIHSHVFGLFVLVIITVSTFLIIVTAQKQQDIRQRAATTTAEEKNSPKKITKNKIAHVLGSEIASTSSAPSITDTTQPIGYETYGQGFSQTCVNIAGWTCDLDSKDTQLRVDIWDLDPGGDTAKNKQLASLSSDPSIHREQGVIDMCGGSTVPHGYSYTIPDSLKDGKDHRIGAYGINVNSIGQSVGGGPLLRGGPKIVNCTASARTLTTTPTNIPSVVVGDTNGDGCVSIPDFQLWLDEFKGVQQTKRSDLNKDGKVDLLDFNIWFIGMKSGNNLCPNQ